VSGVTFPTGSWYVPASTQSTAILKKLADEKGLPAVAVNVSAGTATPLRPIRVGLWDQYGGSMPSGWTRWLFEQFEFPFEVVYPQTLDAGNLNAKFDVLVFVDGAIPARDGGAGGGGFGGQPAAESIPAEFRGWLGLVRVAK